MAFENLLIRTNRQIGDITLDAVIKETTISKVRTTRNPVELGADMNDHAIIEPKEYIIEAVVTDSPLFFVGSGDLITSSGFFGSTSLENKTRSQAAFEALEKLQEKREPITIQTGLRQYENMLLSDIQVSQDKDTSKSIFFTAKLTEIIFTRTEELDFPLDSLLPTATQQQATSLIDEGQKRLQDAAPFKSIGASLIDTFGGWF